MTPSSDRHDARLTLRQSLGRTHLVTAFTSACVAGILLTLTALLVMRFYADHNLELVARAISYTTEAAVVFQDEEAAGEALRAIAEREEVAEARIYLPDGKLLTSWSRTMNTPIAELEGYLAQLILPGPVREPMLRGSEKIGEVELIGHGESLLIFLIAVLLVMLICLLLSAMGALYVAGRMQVSIIGPLRELARVAHSVRRQRTLGMRAPPAGIVELNELGDDFNSLLDELQAWQAHQARENASLLHQATHDVLTGLPNRVLFDARLAQAITEAEQDEGDFALLYLDCDRFKQINDTLGHNAGDDVLITLARRVEHQLRPQDLVCRLGGDEFAILLSPVHLQQDVEEVINRIQQAMSEPVVLRDGQQLVAGISIGYAIHQSGVSASELCELADKAMYLAKRARREEVDATEPA
ncbi:diguanylate cyclase domain-containing protein [Aeromonas jandaei]|uniref:diguanylate cyclase domain-containing protein n=1 Tax=Aeromonas jandaei TaxID=650 RepID=UPI0011166A9A|nr:diguanylate cyclase [Aeromonas jandaei]TNI07470.1 diguanylate cyclase [Aeromonas jandaei]